jgi:copper transport protein
MIANTYRLIARRACALAFMLALLLTSASSAFAHAMLIDISPIDGAMLDVAPAEVTLRFNEPVAPLVLKLLLPDGSTQPVDQIVTEPDGLKATLPATTLPGVYLLSWRVTSADGHPVGGSLTYSVGARSTAGAAAAALASQPVASSSPWSLRIAIWLTRLGLYLALFIGVGATLFRAFIPAEAPPPARWVSGLLWAGLALLPLAVGLQGLDALALPWNALRWGQPWRVALGTAYGMTAWLMLAALIVAHIGAVARRSLSRGAAIVAVLLAGAALASSGHASSAPPQWLARPAVFIHGAAIAAWVGSLLPLMLLLRGAPGAAALLRFSRVIPWVLAVLLISGATLATLQLDAPESLWSTDYGRILSAKLLLVLLLLGVAALNRYALTARVQRGERDAKRWMQRLIGAELLLVLLVFALAAAWRFTPPPRALAAQSPAPVSAHLQVPQAMVDLTLTPQRDRRLSAHLFMQKGALGALDAQEVSLQFSNPALGIEPLQRDAHRGADRGAWLVEAFALPAPGRWRVRIDVLISDFERIELEKDIDIAF